MSHMLVAEEPRWSPAAMGAVAMGAGQALLGLMVLAQPALQTTGMLIVLTTGMTLTAILLARITMPVEAKAVLIASGCLALPGAMMAHDIFGLRSVEHRLKDATQATAPTVAVDPPHAASNLPYLKLRTDGGAQATAFTSELNRYVVATVGTNAAPPEIDSEIAVTDTPDGPSYRMIWTVRRGGERLWCGQMLAIGPSRDHAAAQFGDRIVGALMQPADGSLRCE